MMVVDPVVVAVFPLLMDFEVTASSMYRNMIRVYFCCASYMRYLGYSSRLYRMIN